MKRVVLIILVVFLTACVLPRSLYAKRAECKSGEELVFSIPEAKPEWIDKPHSKTGVSELFVGLSTQNNKLEDGIALAVENANGNIVEALGQVIKKQSQGVLTFEQDEVRQSWGSAGAASYLQHKERRAIYYEKWASYDNCKPSYHYNVWVQISVPMNEFKAETVRAEGYLRELQQEEELKTKAALMPSQEAMQIKVQPKPVEPPRNDYPEQVEQPRYDQPTQVKPSRKTNNDWQYDFLFPAPPNTGFYFTIGSTKAEVLRAQGQPSSVSDYLWSYKGDYVYFDSSGRVSGFSNTWGSLRVIVK